MSDGESIFWHSVKARQHVCAQVSGDARERGGVEDNPRADPSASRRAVVEDNPRAGRWQSAEAAVCACSEEG